MNPARGSQDREIFADRRQNAGICRRRGSEACGRHRDIHVHRPARSRSARGPCLPGNGFYSALKRKGAKKRSSPCTTSSKNFSTSTLKQLEKEPQSPLFPASIGKTGKLSRRPLVSTDAADMLKRRLKQAGLPAYHSPHSFRATGITNFLENDGTLEAAQRIAGKSRVSFRGCQYCRVVIPGAVCPESFPPSHYP
jgi:hypothetical protein